MASQDDQQDDGGGGGDGGSDELPSEQVAELAALLTFNRAYQEAIQDKLAKLRLRLAENLQKQELLNHRFNYNAHKSKTEAAAGESEAPARKPELAADFLRIKGNYFKDRFSVKTVPDNTDTVRKKALLFYDYSSQLKTEWSVAMRNKLRSAVKADAIRLIKTPFLNRIPILRSKLKRFALAADTGSSGQQSKDEYKSVKNLLKETQQSIQSIDSLSELAAVNQVDKAKIDWMKIANIDLNGTWSSNECRLVWTNVCEPNINQDKWTNEENAALIKLARKYRESCWQQIAAELNTGRSAFLCMKRYHEKTVEKYCKRDWTEQEIKDLVELAQSHRVGSYIPFNYLCYLNGTRDRSNVYSCYMRHNPDLQRGHWSPAEVQAFDEAIQLYNATTCWQEIAEHVGSRTALQCRDRFELKYLNPDKYTNWTPDEDKRLLEAYVRYEGGWSQIVRHEFPNRTDHSCLFRYRRLMEWKKQNAWFDKLEPEIKEFLLCLNYKQSKKKASDEEPLTIVNVEEDGQLMPVPVPVVPKFSPSSNRFSQIYRKMMDKKELVVEFVRKWRLGELDIELIRQIDVYTPGLTAMINEYKRAHPDCGFQELPVSKKAATTAKKRDGEKKKVLKLLKQSKKTLKLAKLPKKPRVKLKKAARKEPQEPKKAKEEKKREPGQRKGPPKVRKTKEPAPDKESLGQHYLESINQTILDVLNLTTQEPEPPQVVIPEPPQVSLQVEPVPVVVEEKKKLKSPEKSKERKKRGPYKKRKEPAIHLSALLKEREKGDDLETNSNSENICAPTSLLLTSTGAPLTLPVSQRRATNLKIDQFIEFIKIQEELKSRQAKDTSRQPGKPMKVSQILQTMNSDKAPAVAASQAEEESLVTYLDSLVDETPTTLTAVTLTADPEPPKTRRPAKRKRTSTNQLDSSLLDATTPKAKKGRQPKSKAIIVAEPGSSDEGGSASSPARCTRPPGASAAAAALSEHLVDWASIADESKIPCVVEELNEFKYLYSMKKTSSSAGLFQKFSCIKVDDQVVAIKRINNGQMDAGFISEANIDKIRQVLKTISQETANSSSPSMMTRQARKRQRCHLD